MRCVYLCDLWRMLSWVCTEYILHGPLLNCRHVVASGKMNVRNPGIKWSQEDCSPWESRGDKKGQDWDVAAPATSLTEILVYGDKGTLPRLCHREGLGLRWVSKTGTSEMRPGS